MSVRIIQGDVRERLKELPPDSVDCCVTSPPYYGLRDYGVAGQIGLEETPDAYIQELVNVFREVRRVLKPTGTVFLNLGDSYAGGGHGGGGSYEAERNWRKGSPEKNKGNFNRDGLGRITGLKPKDLLMIPARVALALQAPWAARTIQRDVDRAWLAALIDGEGTIGIRRHDSYSSGGDGRSPSQDGFVPFVSIANSDVALLEKCAEITGYGAPRIKQRADTADKRGIVTRRDCYAWRLDGNKAIDVIRDVYEFLIAKRRQAIFAFTLDCSNKAGRSLRGNGALPADEQAKRETLKALCQRANQRQQLDMPDWCLEPTIKLEPGWWLRSEIIWAKPNPMPESVTDRPTSAHEKMYLLAKAERYYFDADAVREEASWTRENNPEWQKQRATTNAKKGAGNRNAADGGFTQWRAEDGRNIRNVWTIATQPYSEAHFATFPPALIEPCIKAGCPKGGTVLDPFGGAGTTGLVADRLERSAILIELNPEYAAMAEKRICGDAPLFAEVVA